MTPKQVAIVAAAVLVVLGILGFVSGVFRASTLLNLVHVLGGAVGFALARTERGARGFLTGGGTALLVLWLLGVVKAGGWIPLDTADD